MSTTLYIMPALMLLLAGWIMVKVALHYERSKKAVVNRIAAIDRDTLDQLGWKAGPYINLWKSLPFLGPEWKLSAPSLRDQMHDLQRVAIHGLPASDEMDVSVRKSARSFRLYFWMIGVPGSFLVYFIGAAKIGNWLGGVTSTPPIYWFSVVVAGIAITLILPFEKYRKWPNVEEMK